MLFSDIMPNKYIVSSCLRKTKKIVLGLFLISFIAVIYATPVFAEYAKASTAELHITPSPDGVEYVALCSDSDYFGAIDKEGRVYTGICGGQLTRVTKQLPPIRQFDIGSEHFIALDYDGNVYTWGSPTYGQCDFPDYLPSR